MSTYSQCEIRDGLLRWMESEDISINKAKDITGVTIPSIRNFLYNEGSSLRETTANKIIRHIKEYIKPSADEELEKARNTIDLLNGSIMKQNEIIDKLNKANEVLLKTIDKLINKM